MTVYNLPTDARFNVLLTGDHDFVMEFAARLASKDVPFNILPPIDDVDDALMDDMDVPMDLGEVDPAMYGLFADRVVADVRDRANAYTHVIDLGVAAMFERKATIELAASVNPKATVIASSLTSTATEVGMLANVAQRIVGTGLAPSLMTTSPLAELAPGLNTRLEHVERAEDLLRTLGYEIERVEDRVGLVQMRVLATLINEAAFAVMEGVAEPADIDEAMKLGTNYPKGLLAWADEIGIPVVMIVLDALYREYQQERYRPCVLLKQYTRAGWNGRSTGRGFYIYAT